MANPTAISSSAPPGSIWWTAKPGSNAASSGFWRYYLTGRITSEDHVEGDGSVFHKSLMFASYPQDIKGLGTFSIRYNSPKYDDVWAYIRTVRRVRRLSGGAWMDPIGGTDHLQDDIETFNAHPAWYKQYRLLGKEHVLAVANSRGDKPYGPARWSYNPAGGSLQDQFPVMDLSVKPYWHPRDVWEVRPVYVVESVPPEYHPYSRKINWFDAEVWRPYFAETYDKKGEFWKFIIFANREHRSMDGYIDSRTGEVVRLWFTAWGVNADYQRRHATFFNVVGDQDCRLNEPSLKSDDISFAVLRRAATCCIR